MNDFSHKDFVLRINIDKKSKIKSQEQRTKSQEQRTKNKEQRTKNKEQRAKNQDIQYQSVRSTFERLKSRKKTNGSIPSQKIRGFAALQEGNFTGIIALQSCKKAISPKSWLCSPARRQFHRNHRFAVRQKGNFIGMVSLQSGKKPNIKLKAEL